MSHPAGFVNPPPGVLAHKGYDPAWFEILAGVEERHFWFRARNAVITTLVGTAVRQMNPQPRILEVGCGNGNVLKALRQCCPDAVLVGLDLYEQGLERARQRCQCELVAGDVLQPPFPNESFEVVGMFDVLEHLPDDRAVLVKAHSLLAPGGALVLTVPALPSLWSSFDEVAGHYRRYKPKDLATKLRGAGFEIATLSFFMTTIYPLVYASRRWAAPREGHQNSEAVSPFEHAARELQVRPLLNGLLARLLAWERWWISRGGNLPIGTSLVAVARKASR
jgi:SAM-dependent methyltransferase